ncbi:MAG: thermonuclease family protein [Candidatus Bipolaricaulota bacterium]|nr:thermonuclease family protein [Candidatus Bipolaricaulota bacterium]MDW8126645.1 thermonuclease family protein [Candidatus Bipolaricaulota bacterium]
MNVEGKFREKKLLVLAALLFFGSLVASAQPPQSAFPARISRWLDGDTAQIRVLGDAPNWVGSYETVRLLGIDTPEMGEPFSEEALRFFRTLTLGKNVYVELSAWERRDVHSRLLAYLWVEASAGWVLVNEALLRAGLARLLVYYPELEKYYCRFLRALTLAQVDKLGLWGEYKEPIELASIETNPTKYVLETVSVIFSVSRVGQDRFGWSLWAEGSQFGFRAVIQDPCSQGWETAQFSPENLVGKKIRVTGELRWDSLEGGPRLIVYFPEQLMVLKEGE